MPLGTLFFMNSSANLSSSRTLCGVLVYFTSLVIMAAVPNGYHLSVVDMWGERALIRCRYGPPSHLTYGHWMISTCTNKPNHFTHAFQACYSTNTSMRLLGHDQHKHVSTQVPYLFSIRNNHKCVHQKIIWLCFEMKVHLCLINQNIFLFPYTHIQFHFFLLNTYSQTSG